MVDENGNIILVDGQDDKKKKVAELPLEYILLIALVDKLVDRSEHPKHKIVGLRDYVRRHRHDFGGDVEKVIVAYYDSDPEAEAAAIARAKAEREAKKAEREAKKAEREAKREAEIKEFLGL